MTTSSDRTPKAIRRKDNPRIEAIEAEIGRLTSELLELAAITRQELREGAQDVYEDIRDIGPEGISDYDAAIEVLDQRDIEAEDDSEGQEAKSTTSTLDRLVSEGIVWWDTDINGYVGRADDGEVVTFGDGGEATERYLTDRPTKDLW